MTSVGFTERLSILIDELSNGKQNDFAAKIGKSPQTVNTWLNNNTFPSDPALFIKIRALNVNLNWLLTGEGEKYIKEEPTPEGRDLTPIEVKELVANLNQLPNLARDAVVSQVRTLAQEFDKAHKDCDAVDEGEGKDLE